MNKDILDIIAHAKENLRCGIPLEDILSRQELIVLKRNYAPLKFNSKHPPCFEFEYWSALDTNATKRLMLTVDPNFKVYDDAIRYGYATSVIGSTTAAPVVSTRYPYSHWYFHNDGTIQADIVKLKKLMEEGSYPITVSLREKDSIYPNSASSNSPIVMVDLMEESNNESEYVKKVREVAAKEAKDLIDVIKTMRQKASSLISVNSTVAGSVTYATIELSSPALYNMRDTRKLFHIFKCKGANGSPIAFVNRSCGLHVSFQLPIGDAATKTAVKERLGTLWYYIEKQVYEIVPDHRRQNQYAHMASRTRSTPAEYISAHSKYSALNLNKGGDMVEFRFINATSNVNQIENWLKFLTQIFNYALDLNKAITPTIHLFDVITNLYLQDWYIRRKKFLNTKAVKDKATPLNVIQFSKPVKKIIINDSTKSTPGVKPIGHGSYNNLNDIGQKVIQIFKTSGAMNSPTDKRKRIPGPKRY